MADGVRLGSRVTHIEDPFGPEGTVLERYSGPKHAMTGMWKVQWADSQSWEEATDLVPVPQVPGEVGE